MGKSFNDRNRKKGAERAYRKTRKPSKKSGGGDRGDWYSPEGRKGDAGQQQPEPKF